MGALPIPYWDSQKRKPVQQASFLDRGKDLLGDTVLDAIQGGVNFAQGVVGLGSLATGGVVGKGYDELRKAVVGGVGEKLFGPLSTAEQADFDKQQLFKTAQDYYGNLYSDERKQALRDISSAFQESMGGGLLEAASHPAAVVGTVVQSLPLVFGSRGIAKGLPRYVPALGKMGEALGGIGEGAATAGVMAEQFREGNPSGYITPEQTLLAAGSGALTGAIGYGSGKLAGKLGVADVDIPQGMLPAEALKKLTEKSAIRRLAEGAAVEGAEEFLQSAQEQGAQNIGEGKPLTEGMKEAAGMGMLSGMAMGGPTAAFQHKLATVDTMRKELQQQTLDTRDKFLAAIQQQQTEAVVDGKAPLSLQSDTHTLEENKNAVELKSRNDAAISEAAQQSQIIDEQANLATANIVDEASKETPKQKHLNNILAVYEKYKNKEDQEYVAESRKNNLPIDDRHIARIIDRHFSELPAETQHYLEFYAHAQDSEGYLGQPNYRGMPDGLVHASHISTLKNAVEEESAQHQVEHPFHHALASEVGEDTNIVRAESDGIYNSIKQAGGKAVDYVKAMVQRFGETAKKYALQMWNWYKQTPLASERGSFSTKPIEQKPASPWYNKIEEAVKEKVTGKMTVPQLKAMLQNPKVGVSPVEIENVLAGLDETKPQTKQDILDHIKANTTEFEDVVLGEPKDLTGSGAVIVVPESSRTHFSKYTLPGAKEGSYREMFVTAPDSGTKFIETANPPVKVRQNVYGDKKWYLVDRRGEWGTLGFENEEDAISALEKANGSSLVEVPVVWQDGHSQYSSVKNPIVRIRYNERTGPKGERILFVEEMQPPTKDNVKKMPKWLRDRAYQIGVKRVLALAKEQGFDGVAWTTAEQQNERWGTERVDWSRNPDGTFKVSMKEQEGGNAGGINIEEEARRRGELLEEQGTTIRNKEELLELVKRNLREGTAETVAEKVWNKMQTEAEGTFKPRYEFMRSIYGEDKGAQNLGTLFSKHGKGDVVKTTIGTDFKQGESRYIYVNPVTGEQSNEQGSVRRENPEYNKQNQILSPMVSITEKTPVSFPKYHTPLQDYLSKEGKQAYDDFKQGKAVDVDPATRAIFDVANFAELEQSSDPAAASLADAKQVRSITPITSDFFSEKAATAIPEKMMIDGIERHTRNSEGRLIHPSKEGIKNFWKWFGDSKMVDEQGRPIVFYRGDKKDIGAVVDAFDGASYWTIDPKEAGLYATVDANASKKLRRFEQKYRPVRSMEGIPETFSVDNSIGYIGDYTGPDGVPFLVQDTWFRRISQSGDEKSDAGTVYEVLFGQKARYGYEDFPESKDYAVRGRGRMVPGNGEDALDLIRKYAELRRAATKESPTVHAAYLRVTRPLVEENPFAANQYASRWGSGFGQGAKQQLDQLRAQGYDGVDTLSDAARFANSFGEGPGHDIRNVIVFAPTQIKSATGNTGEFSPTSPDIRKLTPFEQSLAKKGTIIGTLIDKLSQKFYGDVAALFNADLVVVNSKNYRSRFIPAGKDGKAKIVININDNKTGFDRVFGHELFHNLVTKLPKGQYQVFKTAVLESIKHQGKEEIIQSVMDREGISREVAEEEFLAEIFAEVFTGKDFWSNLSSDFFGQNIASRLLNHLILMLKKFRDFLSGQKRSTFETKMLFDDQGMKNLHKLVADMVGQAYLFKDTPASGQRAFYTPQSNSIIVDGKQRPTMNSEGRPIHATEEGIRNFWKWFGDSKVVDEQGRPLVVYHGTKSDSEITEFSLSELQKNEPLVDGVGFYFSEDKEYAAGYTRNWKLIDPYGPLPEPDYKRVVSAYLKTTNPAPKELSDMLGNLVRAARDRAIPIGSETPMEAGTRVAAEEARKQTEKLIALGYDGIIRGSELIVFSPTQIKSATGNTGAFDPNNPDIRYNTQIYVPAAGYTVQQEITDTLKNQSAWFKGMWGKIFKPGTKSYKEVMTNIEGILLNIKEWIKEHKWAAVYADLWADPAQVTMVSKIAHDKELKRAIAEHQVVLKHRDAFKGMTRDQLEKMHDDIVRKKILLTYKDENGKYVDNADGIARAKELGYSDAIIAAFKDYKKVSDEIYEELKKIYFDIPDMTTHYGQSIQWYRKNGNYLDTDFDYIITPEKSQLEGSKQYLKQMNLEKSTREIADEGGLDYRTIDPHELFLNYVADTAQLISLHKMMTEASTTMNPKDGLPYAKIFLMKDSLTAAKEGYYAVDDNATRILERLAGAVGFNISYNDNGQTKYHEENGEKVVYSTREEAEDALQFLQNENEVEGREYNVEEAAKAQETTTFRIIAKNKETGKSQKLNQTFESEDAANEAILGWQERGKWADFDLKIEEERASSSPSARLFFRKDMVRMINVLLAKDKIRNNAIGDKVMWAKNFLTSTELAISGFHAMTIMQEVVASTTTWEWAKGNKSIPLANFIPALADSRKLAALASYVLADPKRADEPAVKKSFEELLKTKNPEVWDIVTQFYHAGGMLHQDPSLRSGLHKKAHLSYTGKEDVVNIVNGKVEFNLASMSMDSFASIKEAFKEVGEEELKRNPNSPIKAKIKQALFPAEVTTAWLMEYMIPRAKAAMWMREYTLKLEKNAQKIAAGTVTKEELARDTMKFIEDRFGEVNWKNMWMTPTIKTALQFAFRSFTWFTGSWKALGKAGFDVAKLGWFKLKGENYELTEKGWWGFNAFVAHAMTVFGIKMMYYLIAAAAGGEVPDDDEDEEMTANKVLREALFPRFDPNDPKARVSVPSYVTEAYKIARHIGLVGNEAEYSKLISGRVNSLISRGWEVGNNKDWRGVRIRELDDSLPVAAYKSIMHMMPVPISLDNAIKEGRMRGWQAVPLAFAGFTGAPAAATRSEAINKAYELRGKTMQGQETSEEEMETKQDVRVAMHDFARGDRSTVDKMMKEGTLSKKQFERELTKLPYINGKKNPVYKDQLLQSLRMLSVKDSLEVWKLMTDSEKKRAKATIATKYKNAVKNGTRPTAQLKEWKAKLQDAGIL